MILPHNKGIRSKLAANSTLISALGGTAIFFQQAPVGKAPPYVIFSIAGGGDTSDAPHANADLIYTVKVVTQGLDSAGTAGTIADLIRTILHENLLSLDGGWGSYRCQHVAPFMYPENVDQKQFWHAGGSYRIRSEYVGGN